jgi:hypothetical protein
MTISKVPGFTAEASLQKSIRQYRGTIQSASFPLVYAQASPPFVNSPPLFGKNCKCIEPDIVPFCLRADGTRRACLNPPCTDCFAQPQPQPQPCTENCREVNVCFDKVCVGQGTVDP